MSNSLTVMIAPDSFKGSANAVEIAEYIDKGIKRRFSHIKTIKKPIADGGEGTVSALTKGTKGVLKSIHVTGPNEKQVEATYGMIDIETAVIDVAETSGLMLINEKELNPMSATSFGLGEMIKHLVLNEKVKQIYVGLGGSATNDGGLGMLEALGAKIVDKNGKKIKRGAESLCNVADIDMSKVYSFIKGTKIDILSDVTNPLLGKNGATYIFGEQKGIKKSDLGKIDSGMKNYRNVVLNKFNKDLDDIPGGGAAGGVGAALAGLCNAEIHSGIDRIVEILNIETILKDVDLVITGEGKFDEQSLFGKAPIGVGKVAKKYNKPVIAIVGSSSDEIGKLYDNSTIDLIINITNKPMTLEYSVINVEKLVENAGENAIRAFLLKSQKQESDTFV